MAADRRRIYSKRNQFRQLRVFCHAARLGSITRAAQHLGLSQPSVSIHVRELEHAFEAVLFDRGSFGISLTAAGERLYALAEPLVEGMEGMFAHFAERIEEDLTGRVEIAASVAGAALVLPPSIKRLRDRYPGVRVRVRNHTLGEGMALLRAGEVEFRSRGARAAARGHVGGVPRDAVLRHRAHHLTRPCARRSRDGDAARGGAVARGRAPGGLVQPAVRRCQ